LEVASGSAINRLSSLETASGSAITRLGALETASGSAISRLNSIESTTGSLNAASGSAITRLDALEVASGSAINRLNALEVASGSAINRLSSLETASGSAINRLSALEIASGSAISRLNSLEVTSGSNITRLTNLENKTGSYATTGSNTFVGGAYFSSSFSPTGFTTTASLYTDGGLRVTRDAYISGTLYLNNLTVFGTQSVAYISSSQLNIGTNIITVNTDTPSVRFGGLAVYDSGSTGLTGSLLWDSQANHWVYSNPSGSTYSGGMFISGPRTSTLGSETGTTSCMLLAGQGGDHLTSSAIYHDSATTCIPNTLVGNVGCFSSTITATGTIRSNDVNSYQLYQASNTTDTKLWSIQNLPTSGDFRIRAGNDAFTNGINGITISRTGISSVSVALGGNTTIENSGTFTVGSTAGTGTGILYASTACFASSVCVGGGLVAQQPSTFCDTVGLFGSTPQLYIGATNGASNYTILKWCTTDKSLNIHNQSTGGSPQLVIACNGNIGIKTIAAPSYDLEVRGNIGIISSTSAGLITTSTLCAAGAITGLIRFDGLHTPSLTIYTGPSINACKDDANYATSLVFKTTDGSGGNNVNLRITGAGAATFSSRVNVNGAPDDADIAMVVKAPSGSGKFIMFGRNASDIAVFRISNTGETTANQFISCATDNGSGEYYFIKGNAAVSNNFSIYAYSNTLYYNSYSSMYFRANNTGGSGGDIIFSGGNVGIGTTSPSVPLQIRDSSVSSGGSAIHAYGFDGAANFYTSRGEDPYNAALYLYNNPSAGQGYGTGIIFRAKSDTTVSQIQGAIYTTWTTATDASRTSKMVFTTTNSGTSSDKVTITGNGIVGIGTGGGITTSTYTGKLAVFTSGAGANIAIGTGVNTNNAVMSRFITVNSNNGNSGNEGSSQFYGITSIESALTTSNSNTSGDSGGYIMFKTKGDAGTLDERLRITSAGIACFACQVCAPAAIFTGCVGIGITSPTTKLDVYAGVCTSAIMWGQTIRNEGNAATTGYGIGLKLKISGDSIPNELYKWAGITAVAGTDYSNRTDLAFYTNTASVAHATEKVRITGDGRVGIGITSPDYPLHIYCCSPLGIKIQTCGSNFGSPSINLLNGGVDTVLSATNSGLEIGTWSANNILFKTTQQTRATIFTSGETCFAGTVCAPILSTTTRVLINSTCPCSMLMSIGGYGSTWGGNACYYGGGAAGAGIPNGDQYGNGSAYTYQVCNTSQSNLSLGLGGGLSAGYFKGGPGSAYGGGGAGIVAIGGDGANAESVNSHGGSGLFARGGIDGDGGKIRFAAWFDGGDVVIRCGKFGINTCYPTAMFEAGKVCENTTAGGLLFDTKSVADNNWFCFFQPTSNWAGLMTMHWVAPNDHNRSGAAQVRWSYQNCSAGLGPTTSIFNDSQNATATFRYAGGWLQACITGAGAGYSVQFTIIGARGA
jgi:hypothetical protein